MVRRSDTIPEERACSLLRSAVRQVAETDPGQVGVDPADTAKATVALVDALSETDSAGVVKHSWWFVTLRLKDRTYDAEVRFDQLTKAGSVRPVHKSLGPQ
jgi:hypothetical protein